MDMISKSSFWIKSIFIFSGLILALTTLSYTQPSSTDRSPEMVVDFRGVAKNAIPAVVWIKVQAKKKNPFFENQSDETMDLFGDNLWKFFNIPKDNKPFKGEGSGVIVRPDGYILTNSHVVNGMDTINVKLNDGREFPAKVLGDDPNSDIAVIKIETDDLPYLKLGDSSKLDVGQWVAAIGNPFGLQATLTQGVVSAKGRDNLDIVPYANFIQTDASINAGNSGGPLLSLNGEVIGINTAIATNSSLGNMGIGFAIPSNMAKYVMNEIINNGKVTRGYLGISLQNIDYNLAQAFDLKKIEGALITHVMKDSPAERAGLKSEDVILKIDDQKVESAASLRNDVYMMHPGKKITLSILRDGKTTQVPIEVGTYPEDLEVASSEGASSQRNALGIDIESLNPENAQKYGYKMGDKGVVITKVAPDSPAAIAGIKKGALILSINRQKIENKEQFYATLKSAQPGRPLLLQIRQGDINAFISIMAE